MGTLLYITVASFSVLVQPAVAQETNTRLPLAYPGQVWQGDGSQTCSSEEERERVRNEVDTATLRLLRESVVPLLQNYSCGGSTGWRRVAYLNMSDPSLPCPSVWKEYATHTGCVGEGPPMVAVRGSLTPLVVSSMTRCVGGLSATSWEVQILSVVLVSQSTLIMSMALVSHMVPPADTSGPSLMVLMNFPQITPLQYAPVSLGALIETTFPHLWARTTFVSQA